MLEGLETLGLQLAPMLLLSILLLAIFRRSVRLGWFVGAIALVVLRNVVVTRFFWTWHQPATFEFNWVGKAAALVATLLIAALPMFGFTRSGITLRQRAGSRPAWIVTLIVSLAFIALAIAMRHGRTDTQTLVYDWTVPGLEEEAFFRGILLLALNEAFTVRRRILGAELGWGGLLSSVLFASIHGLAVDHGQVSFTGLLFLSTFLSALLLVWIRERTGSIVAPVIGHGVGDGAFDLF